MNRILIVAALAPSLFAHRQWLLPSSTVLSAADPWVTVDAAVSNELFYFDHVPMRVANLAITGPDGKTVTAENVATGKYRSTFDVHLQQRGTYRIAMVNQTVFATWKEGTETKTWRGPAEAFARAVPAQAAELKKSMMASRVETFVTAGKPTAGALRATGTGLELAPVTHPNDLVTGEAATFQLLRDGRPAAGMEVTVIPGGIRYRDQLREKKYTADAEGKFVVKFDEAGMYWINATTGGGRGPGAPAGDRASYAATVEVMPQ